MLDQSRQNNEMQTVSGTSSTAADSGSQPQAQETAGQAVGQPNGQAIGQPVGQPVTGRAPVKPAPQQQNQKSSLPVPKKKGPPKPLLILLAAALTFGGYKAWVYFQPKNMDQLRVSGRIEGYETNVGAKIAGRVDFIKVREGAVVHKGEAIVKLSDDDIQAQRRGANARLKKAVEQHDQAEQQIEVIQAQINEATLNKQASIEDAGGHIVQAEANVSTARANLAQSESQLAQAQADLKLAQLRKERYGKLAKQGAVSQDESDQADTNESTSTAVVEARKSAVDSARKQLIASVGALTQARTTRLNPGIRNEQLLSARRQMLQAQSQLKSASEEIKNAKAAEDEIKANIAYLNILAPTDGTVTARVVEPGAVVAAGQTVLSLINYNDVYLRAWVSEGESARVRVGQKANVYLDAFKKKIFPGTIIEIDPIASFTPENIYFKDDRVKQVFGMKIRFDDPNGLQKPGMPADADILTDLK
jgi:HlyD family secretion protein